MILLNRKGIGVSEVIIVTAVLIFVLLPIFTSLYEKAYVAVVIHTYEEIGDMAVMTAVSQLNTMSLSEGIVSVSDIETVKDYVYENLSDYQNDRFSIIEYRLDFISAPFSCDYGHVSDFPFFHIEMKTGIRRIANSTDTNIITIHMDIEIPVDR